MLKRKVDNILSEWKEKDNKKPLLVRGARQVGKTTSIRKLGENYKSFIEVNFLEKPDYIPIFSGNIDVNTILTNFSVYMPEAEFIEGETLLFLDEIQECPDAMTAIKFLDKDNRFDVIASGSMLGIDYKRPKSFPVGSLEYLEMYALSFEEFLWACNISDDVISILAKHFQEKTEVNEALNQKMLELFRTYIVIGGMPEVVSKYTEEKNFSSCFDIQETIIKDYKYDIAHFAPTAVKIKAENCYLALPKQLTKDNHKFKYSVVEKGGNARKFITSIDWLIGSYLVVVCNNVSRMATPLLSQAEINNFRLYASDIGLLTAMYGYSIKTAIYSNNFDKSSGLVKGGIYEAAIADVLYKNGCENLFFRKTEDGNFEIEFLLESEDGVIPIEVKAKNSRSKSLDNSLKKPEIPFGYKLVDGNVGVAEKKITLPLYMAMFM